HPAEPVPLHIRNAPTRLMEELGYGAGYKYAHAYAHAYVPQEYLPEALRGRKWYEPSDFGYEKDIKKRMEWWEQLKQKATEGRKDGMGMPELTLSSPFRLSETKGDGRTERRNGDDRVSSGARRCISVPSFRLSVALVFLSACATLRQLAFTEPDLQLREIDVTGIGFT